MTRTWHQREARKAQTELHKLNYSGPIDGISFKHGLLIGRRDAHRAAMTAIDRSAKRVTKPRQARKRAA